MRKLFLLLFLFSLPVSAQTTGILAQGGIGVSCNAITASTSAVPGSAGGCTSFNLLTSGGALPGIYTWQVLTTGSPATLTVTLQGSLDGVTWVQLGTTSSAGTLTTSSAAAYRFLGCIPSTLTGGSSPTITCQISVTTSSSGGTTTNPTSGTVPVNSSGAFVDSPLTVASGNVIDSGEMRVGSSATIGVLRLGTDTNVFISRNGSTTTFNPGSGGQVNLSGNLFINTASNIAFTSGKGQHFNTQSANNDHSGVCSGTTTTCAVAFTTNYISTPSCVATPTTTGVTSFIITTQANTGFTITYAPTGTTTFNYICVGDPN
jgi:hypothetical protein